MGKIVTFEATFIVFLLSNKKKPRELKLVVIILFLTVNLLNAQVNAVFTSDMTSGCSPFIVQFTDQSTGSPATWYWDFGNGNHSTLQNPEATYINPGHYTVSLTVTNGSYTNTVTYTNFITVFENPTADFYVVGPSSGCAPVSVTFHDNSDEGSAPITEWLWDFGDGSITYTQHPVHIFPIGGNFPVSLEITDANGCGSSIEIPGIVDVSQPPTTLFSGDDLVDCAAPHTVNFSSTSFGTTPLNYYWSFGDGQYSTLANPSHTYTVNGIYTVSLTTTDQHSCSSSLTYEDYVQVMAVVAEFDVEDNLVCYGTEVEFINNSTGATNYDWDFGDGETSWSANPGHEYEGGGTYTVTLLASQGGECPDTYSMTITVEEVNAQISVSDTYICMLPTTVQFIDESENAVSWLWDFGDTTFSYDQNPEHTYDYPIDTNINFDVTLTVYSPNGCTDILYLTDFITVVLPTPAVSVIPNGGCIPIDQVWTDVSTYFTDDDEITGQTWVFPDGTTASGSTVNYTLTEPGVDSAMLIIETAHGCLDTAVFYIFGGEVPVPVFAVSDTICASDSVQLFEVSTDQMITSWHWEHLPT
ncbi:MAG: hypothetical protein A2W91_01790 [Bacteroidetes bacterium GWF2_38_335]|nr:MAG: hypothetical protein A2W91_01790 [Bacteroidetes bacterium GWF2_38_335]OFY78799.1 MAG: hypothetical protein A2281_19365 [Bacteroidetes bacterium RIFOXYA12_FULL_38_20]HBS85196.1 hypothetical protein [Bacteroidales bacterium]